MMRAPLALSLLAWCMGMSFGAAAAELMPASPTSIGMRMDIEWIENAAPIPTLFQSDSAARAVGEPIGPDLEWFLRTADRRLSIALQRWSARAGWQLVWEAERDFPIEVEVRLQGPFSSVLQEVMESLATTDYPLQAVLNTQGSILRIRHQEGSLR